MATPFQVKLRNLLGRHNLTQEQLSRALGLRSRNLVSYWACGSRRPSAKTMLDIARRLECDLQWLIDDEMDEEPGCGRPAGWSEAQRIALVLIEDLGLERCEVVRRLAGLALWESTMGFTSMPLARRAPRRILSDELVPEPRTVSPEAVVDPEWITHEVCPHQDETESAHATTLWEEFDQTHLLTPNSDEEERPHEA